MPTQTIRSRKKNGSDESVQQKRMELDERDAIQLVTSEAFLAQQSHLTLAERCVIVNRLYQAANLTPQKLSRIYRRNGIRKKKILFNKCPSNYTTE